MQHNIVTFGVHLALFIAYTSENVYAVRRLHNSTGTSISRTTYFWTVQRPFESLNYRRKVEISAFWFKIADLQITHPEICNGAL